MLVKKLNETFVLKTPLLIALSLPDRVKWFSIETENTAITKEQFDELAKAYSCSLAIFYLKPAKIDILEVNLTINTIAAISIYRKSAAGKVMFTPESINEQDDNWVEAFRVADNLKSGYIPDLIAEDGLIANEHNTKLLLNFFTQSKQQQ